MLHHVSLGVSDVSKAAEFYDAILGALGYERTAQYLPYAIAYGERMSEFWIQIPHDGRRAITGNGVHVAFAARKREGVHRFHESALAHGGSDDGAPGPRANYGPDYYGAFVRDPFGNKIEAIWRPALHRVTTPRTRNRVSGKKAHARRAPAKLPKRKAKRR